MGLFVGLYMLCGIFFSMEAKLLGEEGDSCSLDGVYKLLLIGGVILTGIGMYHLGETFIIFSSGLLLFLLAYLLKIYINKKYGGYC